MKKFILAIAFVMMMAFTASAQFGLTDAYFNNWDGNDSRFEIGEGFSFVLPASHGFGVDTPSAPLGSGLLILGALGAGYAVAKRRR